MQEWLIWHAWKACVPQKGTGGSNPPLSAQKKSLPEMASFSGLMTFGVGKFFHTCHRLNLKLNLVTDIGQYTNNIYFLNLMCLFVVLVAMLSGVSGKVQDFKGKLM